MITLARYPAGGPPRLQRAYGSRRADEL